MPKPCRDCGVDCWALGEMYMLRDPVWQQAAGPVYLVYDYSGTLIDRTGPGVCFLCVGCVELRLGRELTREDFTAAPVNWSEGKSDRLARRLRKSG
jgi:hypothetical protein